MQKLACWARSISMFLAAISLALIAILIPVGVAARYGLNAPIGWIEPVAAILLVAFTFLSAAVTMADRLHVCVNTFTNMLPARLRIINANVVHVLLLALLVAMAVASWELVQSTLGQSLPEVPALPAAVVYAVVPLGFGLMALMVLANLLAQRLEENSQDKADLQLD
ncbi:hypothetical protein CAL18_16200 [Bordetella genomosp. 7]|uniref:TRAP transporter small permease n=1 Tax=Bordetella genomosp. 7 TaxID=1416805 RepID=UPI000B9EA61E|nr:TRAP transporter small permease [Bordetella genomosp. 7]OZI16990.1 hypothetical protein CAL18_16200 [Bordetella genomosp. 7]